MTGTTEAGGVAALRRYLACCRHMTARDRRNSRKATAWLFAWAVGFVATTLGIERGVLSSGVLTYLAVGTTVALGLVALLAYVRFVREAEELQRRIQLEAMALGFGGGFVATFGLSLLERAGVGVFDLGDIFLVMVLFYVVGILLAARRYA